MNKKYLPGIGLVLLILLIFFTIVGNIKHTQTNNSKITSAAQLPKETVITLSKNGFSPSQITIKTGTTILWKNESGKPETVNSDNYPTNQLHKELNFGVFADGSSVVYTFNKAGTYGYHNQFNHTQAGKIVVTN